MLRLKKQGKKTEIVYGGRTSRYSPDFFKGLALASLFHLFLFSALKISFPKVPDESLLLPFTEVDAEWGVEAITTPHFTANPYVIAFEETSPHMVMELVPEIGSQKKRPPFDLEPDFSLLESIDYTMDGDCD